MGLEGKTPLCAPITSMVKRIISGGQTGADRAALDFAILHAIPHGGWCPYGRWAEDGIIGPQYQLSETPSANPDQRTEWNAQNADATVIFSLIPLLIGGSRKTAELATLFGKPMLHLSRQIDGFEAAERFAVFLSQHQPGCLNIAGSRESEEPGIGWFVREVLEQVWSRGGF